MESQNIHCWNLAIGPLLHFERPIWGDAVLYPKPHRFARDIELATYRCIGTEFINKFLGWIHAANY